MRLTKEQLEEAFLAPEEDSISLSTFWSIIHYARSNHGVELRDALHRVRKQSREVSIFVEKILQPEDLDDVVYVIDALSAEITDEDRYATECLRMLQSWRAMTLMQIVIEKRNAMNRMVDDRARDKV